MNFSLQKLESHLDESSLIGGEAIYEAGGVNQLFELERHLWLAEVEAEGKYEVEVKISPSKVLAGTCECQNFLKNKECEHFAAVLLKLRSYLQALKTKKKRARDNKKSNRKLTTNVILEQVSPEDLVSFVRSYAKTNRSFALALKAKFAAQVSQINSIEKYLQLLDSIINMVRRPDRSISVRGVQKINKVLEELLGQVGDNIATENFTEALSQVQSIIEKITPVLTKAADEKGLLIGSIKAAFGHLARLVQAAIPPSLETKIWEYCMLESKKLAYRSNRLDLLFYELMLEMAEEKQQLNQLTKLLDEQIEQYQKEDRDSSGLILTKVHVLDKAGQKKAIKALVASNLANPEVLFYAIEQYRKQKAYRRARQLAMDGLKSTQDKAIVGELEEVLLHLAEEQGDKEGILEFAERRLRATLKDHYFLKLKAQNLANWAEKVDTLIANLEKLPYSIGKRDLIAFILKEEGRHEALLQYLHRVASIDLLREYGPFMIQVYKQEAYELYKTLLNQYLRNHLGRKPSLKIRAVIAKLMQEGESRFASDLVEAFREAYPERHSLMEELAIF